MRMVNVTSFGRESAICQALIDSDVRIIRKGGGYWRASFWLDDLAVTAVCSYQGAAVLVGDQRLVMKGRSLVLVPMEKPT